MEGQLGTIGSCDATTSSFAAFYESEHDQQVRRAYLLTGSGEDAHDVVHDAMIGVYRRWGSLENPAGYLAQSVVNGCRDLARRSGSSHRLRARLVPVETTADEPEPLLDALAALPFRQRAAIILRFYGGWTSVEIGRVLGASPNSVGPWITRGLATLRKELR